MGGGRSNNSPIDDFCVVEALEIEEEERFAGMEIGEGSYLHAMECTSPFRDTAAPIVEYESIGITEEESEGIWLPFDGYETMEEEKAKSYYRDCGMAISSRVELYRLALGLHEGAYYGRNKPDCDMRLYVLFKKILSFVGGKGGL